MHRKGACLNNISLANFYEGVFGFERIESPKFEFKVIWLKISPHFALHLIERSPDSKLPEGPYSASSSVLDPTHLPRGHHAMDWRLQVVMNRLSTRNGNLGFG
uniref:Uncharacterized protein n=1 Tax=Salix viminalis TaxID=40686 RepID=A0A6N2N8H1_SALVM